MPIGLNPIQQDPERAQVLQKYLEDQEASQSKMLADTYMNAQKKIQEAATKAKKKKSKKKLGAITLSNTDNISKCQRVKTQLNKRLAEIYASTMDDKMKQTLAKDVMLQIMKVEMKINEIQKRELAVQQEKNQQKDETEQARRKRQADMRKRSSVIKRDFLPQEGDNSAEPVSPSTYTGDMPAVSLEIGGSEITLSDASLAAAELGAASFEAVV